MKKQSSNGSLQEVLDSYDSQINKIIDCSPSSSESVSSTVTGRSLTPPPSISSNRSSNFSTRAYPISGTETPKQNRSYLTGFHPSVRSIESFRNGVEQKPFGSDELVQWLSVHPKSTIKPLEAQAIRILNIHFDKSISLSQKIRSASRINKLVKYAITCCLDSMPERTLSKLPRDSVLGEAVNNKKNYKLNSLQRNLHLFNINESPVARSL